MKYDNQLKDFITIHDIKFNKWISTIKKDDEAWFILEMENQDEEIAPPQLMDKEDAENIAVFCRGYLLAWEYVQRNGELN
jgi:hypothetical protein